MNFIFKHIYVWIWPLIILSIHAFATVFSVYYYYVWFDSPMHLAGGAAIGLSTYYFFRIYGPRTPLWTMAILMVTTASLAAIGWEWLEYGFDAFYDSHHQPGLADTMKDLYFGIVGAMLAAVLIIKKSRK